MQQPGGDGFGRELRRPTDEGHLLRQPNRIEHPFGLAENPFGITTLLIRRHSSCPRRSRPGGEWQSSFSQSCIRSTADRDQNARLFGEDVPGELHEEAVIVALHWVVRVVLGDCRTVWYLVFGVDRADRAHIGLVAGSTRRTFVDIHIQQLVAENLYRLQVRRVTVLDDTAAGHLLGVQGVRCWIELVNALHRANIDTRTIFRADTRLRDDRNSSHDTFVPADAARETYVQVHVQPATRPASSIHLRKSDCSNSSRNFTLR